MNAITKLEAMIIIAGAISFGSMSANAWWDNDDHYDRWYGGPWYGGYPGYGWGGYPGYGYRGYPGYGWGGYPGYGHGKTIIVIPQISNSSTNNPAPKLPR
jgi:hypothetical protein